MLVYHSSLTEKIKQKATKENQVALDFFGRPIVPRAETSKPLKNLKMEGSTIILG